MDLTHLLAATLFSETKDLEDAKGIANVIMNRTKRPERFGATIPDVIYAPAQFSGVGTEEFNKAANMQFKNKDEEEIFKQFLSVSSSAIRGGLEDNINGADHFVNLKISRPSWSKIYPKTAKIDQHTYYKEILKK